jgi:hypothetical protein
MVTSIQNASMATHKFLLSRTSLDLLCKLCLHLNVLYAYAV